jgi:excisionase family DNA binding protein
MHFALIHALPLSQRRVFNREEAASYVGVSPGHFSKLVRQGAMPAPLPTYGRARRWDKAALEQALDSTSGADGSRALSPYDQWRKSRGQG